MGGINLRMGNYEYTPDDRMWDAVALTGEQELGVRHLARICPEQTITEGRKEKWAQRKAIEYMRAHPGLTLRRSFIKFADFWGLEREFMAGVQNGLYAPPSGFRCWARSPSCSATSLVVMAGAAGIWLAAPDDRRMQILLLLPVLVIVGGHTIVFGHSRYHLPLIPIFGAVCRGAVDQARRRSRCRIASSGSVRSPASARCWRSGSGRSSWSIWPESVPCSTMLVDAAPDTASAPAPARRPSERRESARCEPAHSRRPVRSGRHALRPAADADADGDRTGRDAAPASVPGTARPGARSRRFERRRSRCATIDRAPDRTAQLEAAAARAAHAARRSRGRHHGMDDGAAVEVPGAVPRRRPDRVARLPAGTRDRAGRALGLSGRRRSSRRWASAASFSVVLCATDPEVGAFKPHPRGFLAACERWQLDPAEVLMVGDRADVDAAGAAAAGMPCVIVGRAQASPADSSGVRLVPSLERLRHVLDDDHASLNARRGFDLWAYVQIARVDHWFKNVFMLLGVILAVFYEPSVVVVVERRAAARRRARDLPGRLEQLRAQRAARRPATIAASGEAVPSGAVGTRAPGARLRRMAAAGGGRLRRWRCRSTSTSSRRRSGCG